MSYSRKVPAGNTELNSLSEMFSAYEEEFHQGEAEIRRLLATAGGLAIVVSCPFFGRFGLFRKMIPCPQFGKLLAVCVAEFWWGVRRCQRPWSHCRGLPRTRRSPTQLNDSS